MGLYTEMNPACEADGKQPMDRDAENPQYDPGEFHQRWSRARVSAFRSVDPENKLGMDPAAFPSLELESGLLARFSSALGSEDAAEMEKQQDALLRGVFENSRKLALSLAKRLGVTFEVQDFHGLLESSGIPCFQGRWSRRPMARILERKGCTFCVAAGPKACDYWREALDGLVMGLGEKERLARHACVRHGDLACIDVLYTESTAGDGADMAWGPLPEHMALDLFETTAYFQLQHRVSIDLKGFREGVLYFGFNSSTDALCGTSNLLTRRFEDMVREKFPGLSLKDVTPQAVLGEQAG